MAQTKDSAVFTVRDVADALGVTNATIATMVKDGQLPAMRVGKARLIRISEGDLREYLGRPEPAPLPGRLESIKALQLGQVR